MNEKPEQLVFCDETLLMEIKSETEAFPSRWKELMELFLDMIPEDAEEADERLDENIEESLCLSPLLLEVSTSFSLYFNEALTWLVLMLLVERM